MKHRHLGRSGLLVSEISYGNWITHGSQVEEEQALACVRAALDNGITTFDTADVYAGTRAEAVLGRALKGERRQGLEIFTKVFWPTGPGPNDRGLSRKHILESIDGSLQRLQTDYVDLYQHHQEDPETPLAETIAALDELVREGKIRAYGTSNYSATAIEKAAALAQEAYVSEQSEYSWLTREAERELLPACARLGLGFIPYFPLANGLLTGKYRRGRPAPEGTRLQGREISQEQYDQVEALEAFARERGLTLLEVAIGALTAQTPVASVIAGATKPEQVRANAAADWEPTADDLAALRALG
jgi:aryl-alcohol dehydrogenase-like predicted oxidoreductase